MPEVFNQQLAMDRVGGDEELLREVVEIYLVEYPELLSKIQKAVSDGDAAELYRAAHTLKGSLGTLGAEPVQDQALALELRGRGGTTAGTETMVSDLERLLLQLHSELSISVGLSS